jgi:predicted small lipoprotein YifL
MRSALPRTGTILLLLAAAGCGQKGPLYLPDKTRTPVPASSGATPAPAQSPAAQPAPAQSAPAQSAPATPPGSSGS